MNTPTLKKGCTAYYDSFAGLVPVKVLAVMAPKESPLFDLAAGAARVSIKVRFRVTETLGAYKAGDEQEDNSLHVVPKGAIVKGAYQNTIGIYRVECECDEPQEQSK